MPNPQEPQVLLSPLKPALILGMAQKIPVLVRIQAPDADPTQVRVRGAYHLSLVIDRSGSMGGEPLLEAVRCARHMIDRLAPTDQASLVVFDDKVRTLVPAAQVGDRQAYYAALARIREGGCTNLHGGWKAGAESLLPGAAEASLSRVILLSDGNANAGEVTETPAIAALCAEAADKGVTTSTYGLGRAFNENLMVEMAKRGTGNHYYGDTATDLLEPFAEEFDLIASLYARHVRLALGAPQGVKITVINDYPIEDRDGFPLIRLPDIPWGAEAWVLVELEIPAGLALDSGNQLLQAGVTATTPEGAPIQINDATLTPKAMPVQAWEVVLPDPLVVSRMGELEAGRLLAKARSAAESGDWATIDAMLTEARRRFADHPWVLEVLQGMAEIAKEGDTARFSKESLYSSTRMHRRLSAKEEALDSMSDESAKASFLRRKRHQGKAQFGDPPEGSRP
jgi:Ca-activated chloride channel family protein